MALKKFLYILIACFVVMLNAADASAALMEDWHIAANDSGVYPKSAADHKMGTITIAKRPYKYISKVQGQRLYRKTYGDAGRLIIPDLGIDVALYRSWGGLEGQYIVDAPDSAVSMPRGIDHTVFADHNYDGFSGLYSAYPGCRGYIEYADGSRTYITCQEVHRNGINSGPGLYDDYGADVYYKGYPISMYTCNGSNIVSVTITCWSYS